MHVFTYGSLVFPEVWKSVTGADTRKERATLRGYRNLRVARATFPGILYSGVEDHIVQGIAYLDTTPDILERLDQFEDTFYQRMPVEILTEAGQILVAEAYTVPPEKAHVLTNEEWNMEVFEREHLRKFIDRCCPQTG